MENITQDLPNAGSAMTQEEQDAWYAKIDGARREWETPAALPEAADAQPAPVELVLEGSGQLSMKVGGKDCTDACLRLLGGRVDVEGSYEKGDVLVLRVEAVVREITFRDKVDGKTNQVTGSSRIHGARIVGLSVQESYE